MTDNEKPTIQKHEKSNASMQEKLGVVEVLQATAQEQMGQLKMEVARHHMRRRAMLTQPNTSVHQLW